MENGQEKNLELQVNESSLIKTSEEKFHIARESKKIKFASQQEVRQALRYAMTKIGLRGQNFPKDEEKLLLLQHVYQNFPENTTDEIKLAFDWGIEGRLDEDINCFENFSCLYFTRIMRAYNRLALAVKEKKEEKPIALPAPKKEERIEDPEAYAKFLESGYAEILRKNGIKLPK